MKRINRLDQLLTSKASKRTSSGSTSSSRVSSLNSDLDASSLGMFEVLCSECGSNPGLGGASACRQAVYSLKRPGESVLSDGDQGPIRLSYQLVIRSAVTFQSPSDGDFVPDTSCSDGTMNCGNRSCSVVWKIRSRR